MTHPSLNGERAFGCPKCEKPLRVVDSRPSTFMGARAIRRRRVCVCGHRFTTFEIPADIMRQRVEELATTADASAASLNEALQKLRTLTDDR